MNKSALVISRVFDPIVELVFVTVIAAIRSGPVGMELYRFLVIFFLGIILPPTLLRFWAVKTKKINWDVTERRKRPKILLLLFLFGLWNLLLVRYFGNIFLFRLFVLYQAWLTGFGLLSLRYKLSGHAGASVLAAYFFIQWFGPFGWPLAFLIPLIGWARIKSREHTLGQVLVGIGYSIVMVIFMKQVYPM